MKKRWEVWSEGFAVTGQSGGHELMGTAVAETFAEACAIVMKEIDPKNQYFDPKTLSYWACRLFDNASDASKSYG